MSDIPEILQDLGYRLRIDGNGWRSSSLYRNGNNPTSLKINQDGSFYDFVTNQTGDFTTLIGLTTGQPSAKYLQNRTFSVLPKVEAEIEQPAYFSEEYSYLLESRPAYPESRGISLNTLRNFECGVIEEGKMANRFCFIVRNSGKIVGITGRALFQTDMKWKILGRKKYFLFPLSVNTEEIRKTGQVILVESIFDCLSLWEAGIKNSFVLFGLTISPFQIMNLARVGAKRVVVALNGDFRGAAAADKLYVKLAAYFDRKNIKVVLPDGDWNDMLVNLGAEAITKKFL